MSACRDRRWQITPSRSASGKARSNSTPRSRIRSIISGPERPCISEGLATVRQAALIPFLRASWTRQRIAFAASVRSGTDQARASKLGSPSRARSGRVRCSARMKKAVASEAQVEAIFWDRPEKGSASASWRRSRIRLISSDWT